MLVQVAVNISPVAYDPPSAPEYMGHERRECLYNDAVKWLRDVQSSKASPDLPLYISPDGDTDTRNPVRSGCMPPNRYDY